MLHFAVEHAFDELLCCWRAHDVLTARKSATVRQRAGSRQQLDAARRRMHALRIAVHPEPDERNAAVERVWCESLETVVHLRWVDRHMTRPGFFACVCGDLVQIDWNRLGVDKPWSG